MPKTTNKPDASSIVQKILSEDVLSIAQARAQIFEATGQRPDKATLCRWIHKGCHGVKLEAIRLGGQNLFTSVQAIHRFIVARTEKLAS
jgi:hypothetical protein